VHPPGDWYGYVTKENAGEVLQNAMAGKLTDQLWRGRYLVIFPPPAAAVIILKYNDGIILEWD